MNDCAAIGMAGQIILSVLVAILVLYIFKHIFQRTESTKSVLSEEINETSKKEVAKQPSVSSKLRKTEEKKTKVKDIEDILKGSLIPVTVKQMKRNGVVPYTAEQKASMLSELEGHLATPNFAATLRKNGITLKRDKTEVFQLNIGLYCNQACTHCHVDSSPKRKEMMTREVVDQCLKIIRNSPSVKVIDITGGAPELNREFRYLVEQCRKLEKESKKQGIARKLRIIDRCNLTVLLEKAAGSDLKSFFAKNRVHVIASLPCYLEDNVDSQRGSSVFQRSIRGLKMLNSVGYGSGNPDLRLDLVYNPTGVHLPPARAKLQVAYKKRLMDDHGISFDHLICITNMPINRFYEYLKDEKKLDKYMGILKDGFNPETSSGLMCRTYFSIKWDGKIYDCDFNQQVELHPKGTAAKHGVSVFDITCTDDMLTVPIATAKHCYGCTAGAGSS